jgi:hypothetical protein
MGNKLNVNEVVRPILDVVRRLFGETCDQLFPIQLQELVERIFVALIFRAFHKDMCLSEKNVLPRDFAFVILKCINGDTKAPISSVIKQHFGVSSSDIIKFFDGCCAHLMPMLMSTDTISGFIGGETIEELTAVIEMLSEIFFALETCISILSMTTSSYFENTLSVRNKMNIVSTLLSNTYDHLRILISILDAKRTTISINLKKDESKLGAVVSKRPVNQNMTEFVGFAKCILEDISTKKITVLHAVNHVSRFIDLHTHDKHICTVAKKFIEDLNQLPDVDLLRQSLILRRNVLELLERTVSSGKGTVRLIELFLGLKVTTADKQNVFLGFPSVVKKGTFNHSDELCKMYVMLSSFMVMDGVLGEEQCPAPINNFVSQQSFEALMTALNAFDEKHEHQILRVVKKQDSGSILAEITVQIDELYQRSLNRLLHYSKMI